LGELGLPKITVVGGDIQKGRGYSLHNVIPYRKLHNIRCCLTLLKCVDLY